MFFIDTNSQGISCSPVRFSDTWSSLRQCKQPDLCWTKAFIIIFMFHQKKLRAAEQRWGLMWWWRWGVRTEEEEGRRFIMWGWWEWVRGFTADCVQQVSDGDDEDQRKREKEGNMFSQLWLWLLQHYWHKPADLVFIQTDDKKLKTTQPSGSMMRQIWWHWCGLSEGLVMWSYHNM